jgi:hypothetical protein
MKIKCHYCKQRFYFGELTKDHVVPQAHGGRNIVENIVPCCPSCNTRKADTMPTCTCWFCRRAVNMWVQQRESLLVYAGGVSFQWQHQS